jgi:cysteine desulfurase
MSSIYLDWAATAPPVPEIQEQVQRVALESFANPSSLHSPGREAEKVLSDCRRRMARLLGCGPAELLFTSGATEANNMVLFSLLHKKQDRRILISGIEHASVYEPAQTLKRLGFEVVQVPADNTGKIDPDRIRSALDERTVAVAVMLVNNETGRIQPIREIAGVLRDYQERKGKKILLHTDAVQALGKIPFNPRLLDIDSAALSAHKIGGPRGAGALYVRRGRIQQFLFSGGGQEYGRRPGTENLPGIYGFVLAAEKAVEALEDSHGQAETAMAALLGELEGSPGVSVIPAGRTAEGSGEYSPYILNFSIPPLPGELLVRVLEEEGFIVSTGSACSSKKKNRFRILENMGVSRRSAFSAVRVSTGPGVRGEQLSALAAAIRRRVPQLLKATPG